MHAVFPLFLLACRAVPQQAEGEECNINTRHTRSIPQYEANTRLVRFIPQYEASELSSMGMMATSYDNGVYIWEVESSHLIRHIPFTGLVKWSSDGSKLLIMNSDFSDTMASLSLLIIADTWNVSINTNAPIDKNEFWDQIDAAWSPNGSMIVTTWNSRCQVWNSSSGQALGRSWSCNYTNYVFWSPGPLIGVESSSSDTVSSINLDFYYPNSTLFANITPVGYPPTWGPNLTLAGISEEVFAIFRPDGTVIAKTQVSDVVSSAPVWSPSGRLLAVLSLHGIEIRSAVTLDILLIMEEAVAESEVVRFINETMLVTRKDNIFSFWSIQIPMYEIPIQWPTLFNLHGWVDPDHLLFVDKNGEWAREVEVRTGAWTDIDVPFSHSVCVVNETIYSISMNGTVRVIAHGKTVEWWETEIINSTIYCSQSSAIIATVSGDTVYIWNRNTRQLLSTVVVGMDGVEVSFVNEAQLGFQLHSPEGAYIWNFTASRPQLIAPNCSSGSWNSAGTWLACNSGIYDSQGTLIFSYSEQMAGYPWQWSNDGTISLRLETEAFASYCPMLDVVLPEPPVPIFADRNPSVFSPQVAVNPVTLEGVVVLEDSAVVWLSTPVPYQLTLGRVGQLASLNVTVAGAQLLRASTRTMLRWVDASTSMPRCMFLSGTVIDAYTWVSEPVTVIQPGLYNIYFEYPTETTSPWIVSEYAVFTLECPEGATSALDAMEGRICSCLFNFYAIVNPLYGMECKTCPPHGQCNGTTQVLSAPGYWPLPDDPTHFIPCASGACVGNNLCGEYYYGPVCGLCKPGAGQHGFSRCQKCGETWAAALLMVFGILCWIGLCVVQSLFALGWKSSHKKQNHSSELASVLISTTQANALFGNVNVDLSGFKLAVGEETTQSSGIQTAVFSCLLISAGVTPEQVHYVKQILLLLLPPVAWLLLCLIRSGLRRCGVQTSFNVVRVSALVVWISLQSALSTSLLQTLACTRIRSASFNYRLDHDLSVICYDQRYWLWVGLVTIPGLIIVVVFPLALFWLLHFRPTENRSGYLKFLIKSHRTDWWFLVIFFRKLMLVVIVTLTRNPFYVASCMLLSGLVHIIVVPSTSQAVHVAEAVSLMVSAFIFAAAGGLGYTTDAFATYKLGPILLTTVGLLSYAIQLGLLAFDRWQSTQTDKDDQANIVLYPIDNTQPYTRLLNSDT